MAFADLTANLRLNIAQFTNAMNGARQQAQRFSSHLAAISKDGTADELIKGYTTLNDRLHRVGLGARDVARIVAGMTISQTFYGITRSIREATDALWSFNESLDYAQVTYGALFGNTELASNFIDTLKQFSIDTIFEYSDIEGMARKLSAYGIEYKNLMYIIEGLTNIGTISGDTAALERLAVAIGQINAKGTLKAEEMRQLANAYTPIYDILRDKLGLSEDELGMVGDLGISSADAINAIIEYANETFGATADAAVYTITGLNNRIVDSLKVMGADIMAPITTFYKSLASYIAGQLENIHNIYKTSGLGGVFEYLVPSKEWQQRIRSFIASIKNAISTLASLVMTLWPYIKQFFGGMIDALTLFLGVLNVALGAMVGFFQSVANNTPILSVLTSALVAAAGGWLLFKIQAMGAAVISVLKVIIVDVAKAVVFLTTVLTKHPLIAGLTILGAVLLGVATNANNTNSAISKLINAFNSISIGGDTADDILQAGDAMEEGANKGDEFWHEMEEGASDAEDAIEGAGDAAKKAGKSLLSFDEVFRLSDDAESGLTGLDSLDGLKDLTDAFSGLGEALIPEIPDLSTFANDFISSLYDNLWDSIKTIASGGATGALIGGIVGFAIGGFVTKTMAGALAGARWGAKIGGIAGAAFAGFWTDTYKELEASLIKIAVGGATGTLIGGLVGMVLGAFATKTVDGALAGARLGASIGSVLGIGIGSFWAAATEEMSNAIEGIIVGGGTGALLGGLTGLLIGAFSTRTLEGALTAARIGAGIGGLLGGAFGGIFGAANDELKKQIEKIVWGSAEAALSGGIAGMIIGAFVTRTVDGAMTGAKLGSGIGGLLGGAFSGFFGEAEATLGENLENLFSGITAASYGSLIGGLLGMILGAIVGACAGGVGAIPGAKAGASIGAAIGGLYGLYIDFLNDLGVFDAITEWLNGLWSSVSGGFDGALAGISKGIEGALDTVSKSLDGVWAGLEAWFADKKEPLSKAWEKLWGVANWIPGFKLISTWFSNMWEDISHWFDGKQEPNENLWAAIWDILKWNSGWTLVSSWFETLWGGISGWFEGSIDPNKSLWENLWTVANWIPGFRLISNWFSNMWSDISHWFDNKKEPNETLWESLWDITTWLSGWNLISEWFGTLWNSIGLWFNGKKESARTNWSNLWKSITSLSPWNIIKSFFENLWKDVEHWFDGKEEPNENLWTALWDITKWVSGWSLVSTWFSNLWQSISSWFTNLKTSVGTWWESLWSDKQASVNVTGKVGGAVGGAVSGILRLGHAKGGIFNREHIARFAEGNKAEAVIPLEDYSAMAPFVTAISDGILQGLLPALSTGGGSANSLPPMYVGTLIADERGLQQLFKKFELYEAKELARKGLA